MRMRGFDEETEQYIGNIEVLAGEIGNLTRTASTPGGISVFTDETKETYKSTYQLLKDISVIYDELTDKQQAGLLEQLGGKRGGQVIAAILSNFEAVESSIQSMSDSAGNAMQEMSIIEESLEFKLNALKETGVGLWQNLIDRGALGEFIDFGTDILEILGNIIKQIGLLGPALAGVGIVAFIKNFEKLREVGDVAKAFKEVSNLTKLGGDITKVQNAIKGLSEVNQIAALSTTALTASEQAQILTNNGFTASATAAALAQNGFTKKQAEGALIAAGYSEAEAKATVATISFATAQKSANASSLGFGSALKGLWSTLLAHPFMLVAAAAAACIGIFTKLASASVDASKAADEAFSKAQNDLKSITDESKSLDELIDKYKELKESDNQDASTRSEIASIQKEIVNLVGDQASGLDLVNGSLDGEMSKLRNISAEMREQIRNASELQYLLAKQSADKAVGNKEYLTFKGLDFIGDVTQEEFKKLGTGYSGLFQGVSGKYGLSLEGFDGAEMKLRVVEEMMSRLQTMEGWRTSELYLALTQVQGYYQSYIDSYTNAAHQVLDSAIMVELANEKYDDAVADTAETFQQYRDDFVDLIANDADIQNAIINGDISREDIEQAVTTRMSTLDQYSKGFEEWSSQHQATVDQAMNAVEKKYAEFKDALDNKDISNWFDGLQESDKEIVYDIYLKADKDSINTLDDLQRKLKATKDAATIASRGFTSFSEIVSDPEDGSFSAYIDSYTGKIESLRKAYDSLTGAASDREKLSDKDFIELALQFPDLAPYINDTDKLKEKILELIDASGKDADAFLDSIIESVPGAKEQVDALRQAILNLADISVAPDEFQELINYLDGMGPASKRAAEAVTELKAALAEGSYGDGLEARGENFLKMQEKYKEGEIGDSDFRAYADYFGIDLFERDLETGEYALDEFGRKIARTYEDIGKDLERVGRYAGAYWDESTQKWATDADVGMRRWLDDISEMENGLISFDQTTHELTFDPSLLFDSDALDKVAQEMGITSEYFIDLLNNYRKFVIDWSTFSNEDLQSALETAGLFDGKALHTEQIRQSLEELGYTSEIIDEIINRAKTLSDTDIELEISAENLEDADKAYAELQEKIGQMQSADFTNEEQVQGVVEMLEGLEPEIQAQVVAKLKEDPETGDLAEQAEEILNNKEVPVKTEAEALADSAETWNSTTDKIKEAADALEASGIKITEAFEGKFSSSGEPSSNNDLSGEGVSAESNEDGLMHIEIGYKDNFKEYVIEVENNLAVIQAMLDKGLTVKFDTNMGEVTSQVDADMVYIKLATGNLGNPIEIQIDKTQIEEAKNAVEGEGEGGLVSVLVKLGDTPYTVNIDYEQATNAGDAVQNIADQLTGSLGSANVDVSPETLSAVQSLATQIAAIFGLTNIPQTLEVGSKTNDAEFDATNKKIDDTKANANEGATLNITTSYNNESSETIPNQLRVNAELGLITVPKEVADNVAKIIEAYLKGEPIEASFTAGDDTEQFVEDLQNGINPDGFWDAGWNEWIIQAFDHYKEGIKTATEEGTSEAEISLPDTESESEEIVYEATVDDSEYQEFKNDAESTPVDVPVKTEITSGIGNDEISSPTGTIEVDNSDALSQISDCSSALNEFADRVQEGMSMGLSVNDEDGVTTGAFLAKIRDLANDPENAINISLNSDDSGVANLVQSVIDGKSKIEGWTTEMSQALVNAFPSELHMPPIDVTPLENATQAAKDLGGEIANVSTQSIDETSNAGQLSIFGDAASNASSDLQGTATATDTLNSTQLDLSGQINTVNTLGTAAGNTASQVSVLAGALSNLPGSIGIPGHAKGTKNAKDEVALLGDEYSPSGEPRPELVISNGSAYLAGVNGPVISKLNSGDIVYPYKETKKILSNNKFSGSLRGAIPAFSQGNKIQDDVWAAMEKSYTKNAYNGKTGGNTSGGVTYYDNSTNVEINGDEVAESGDISAFAELIKNSDFKSFVDEFLNSTSTLRSALENISSGKSSTEVFDDLFKHFSQDAEALTILGKRSEFTAEKIQKLVELVKSRAVDSFNAQFGNLSTEEDIAALQNYMDTILEMGEVMQSAMNVEAFKERMNELYGAIKESVSATGLTADSIAALQGRYQDLEGYSESDLFEKTANGIHLNANALRQLESEFQALQKSKMQNSLQDLQKEYKRLTKEIDALNDSVDEASKADLYSQRDSILQQIDDVSTLISQYDGLTGVFEKWSQAQSMGEEGDLYDSLEQSLDNMIELYEQGLVGTNKFRAAVQFLTNEDVSNWSVEQLIEKYKANLPTVIRFFTEGTTGVENFLNAVQGVNAEWAGIGENGEWFVNVPDLEQLSDSLGLHIETVESILRKASDFGFDVKFTVDATELDASIEAASDEEHEVYGETVWENDTYAVDKYINSEHKAYGTMVWENDTSKVDEATATRSGGKSEAGGTALAGGNWGISGHGTALSGELGPEILVRNGKWYLLGEEGAEFFDYRPQDIIFDASQTEQLLRNHKLSSGKRRGTTFAQGSAFRSGTSTSASAVGSTSKTDKEFVEEMKELRKSFQAYGKNNTTSTTTTYRNDSSSSESTKEINYEKVDWVEKAITRINSAIDRLKKIADSAFKTLKTRLDATSQEITKITSALATQEKAYNRYMQEADSVGLSGDLKQKVRDGAIDINLYDDDTRELISEYEDWYTKAIACKDAIDDLHESLSSLYKERFDKTQEDYADRLELLQNKIKTFEGTTYTTVGKNNKGVSETIKLQKAEVELLSKQLQDMNTAFEEAVSSGAIPEYSEAWYDMADSLDDVRQQIIDAYNDISASYVDTFNNLESFYSEQKSLLDDEIELFASSDNRSAASNNQNNGKQLAVYYDQLKLLDRELKDLTKARDDAVNSGAVIKGSQAWTDMQSKINDVSKSIADVHENIAATFTDTFNNIETQYGHYLDDLTRVTDRYNKAIDLVTAKGYLTSTKYYEEMSKVESSTISALNKELKSLEDMFKKAMDSGEIEAYSESWYSMRSSIEDVKDAISDANLQLVEYANTMRELEWSYFDLIQSKINELNDESDFLISLMKNRNLYQDNGQFNENGMATLGLRAQNYDVAMVQADKYAKEILNIDKQIAKDSYNTTLIDRRKELLKLQRDSILAAESEKDAIKSLVSEGINKELDGLKSLVDTYKENLDNAKDLYEYQKNVEKQTKNITDLRKQLSAYSNDLSQESQARIQKITVELQEAEDELAETEYERFVSDAGKLLDDLYTNYQEMLNQRLDNVDGLLGEMITTVNDNASIIWDTISVAAENVGYTISSGFESLWNDFIGINGTVATYAEGIIGSLTSVGQLISLIDQDIKNQISNADLQATRFGSTMVSTSNATNTTIANAANSISQTISAGANNINASVVGVNSAVARAGTGIETRINAFLKDMNTNSAAINGSLNNIWDLVNKGLSVSAAKKATTTATTQAATTSAAKQTTATQTKAATTTAATTNQSSLNFAPFEDDKNTKRITNDAKDEALRLITTAKSISSSATYINDAMQNAKSTVGNASTRVTTTQVGSISVHVDNVQDYDGFLDQMKKDTSFEKLVHSITTSEYTGSRKLGKYGV